MSNIVTIAGVQSARITFKDRPVCTTQQLAQFYNCEPEHILDNHRKNSERFEEGKHFVRLGGAALKAFKEGLPESIREPLKFAPKAILWTELGAARHAKMLTTDKAWDVFEEMEGAYFRAKEASIQPAIPKTFAEALRLAADEHERRELAEAQRDEAIRTKALIGAKREASAMGKASAAVREVKRLTEELGRNMRHATIVAVEKAMGHKPGTQDWRPLRKFCKENGLSAEKVVDPRWGEVKAWPAEAWNAVYGIDLRSIFPPKGSA